MLDQALKEQLKTIFKTLESDYIFDISVSSEHETKSELFPLSSQCSL